MEEDDHEFDYATMPIDLSKLASDQRKMMELNIRHMKRLMAPLKVNMKGDVQKRINALAEEINPVEPKQTPTDKKKVLELSIKDKIKEITKISSSHDFGKHQFIRRSKKLEDPSKPVMRLDVLAMSKNYLEQKGYQDEALEFDLIKRQEQRKRTLVSEKKKKEDRRSTKYPTRLSHNEYGLVKDDYKTPLGMTSPRENFAQDLQSFKMNIQDLRRDVNSMIQKVSPRKKWVRENSKDAFTPRGEQLSSRQRNMGQTGTSLHPLDPMRTTSQTNKMKMTQSHTSGLSIDAGKKILSTLSPAVSQLSSVRHLVPIMHPSMPKTSISGYDSGFMLSPKSPNTIQEDVREYVVHQNFHGGRTSMSKNERSASMSKIIDTNNRSRSRDKSLSKDVLELNPEVEELFKDFQSSIKKGLKKKKHKLKSIEDIDQNEMNKTIKQAIKHYYSPEKPDTKVEVSKRTDSIVENYGYQTYDNTEIIKGIVSSNKYKGKTWEQIQYLNRIEKTEMYLKMIRAKKTKAVTVE